MSECNFEMFKGDTRRIEITVKDTAGLAVDLTGATIHWALASSVDGPILIEKTNSVSPDAGIEITNAAGGVFEVTIGPTDTDALTVGKYYHEAEVIESDGTVTTVLWGKLTTKKTLI